MGAERADRLEVGYSAQGPSPLDYGTATDPPADLRYKPDLCAPSRFRDDDDAADISSGTSAACAVVAGLLAALRSDSKLLVKSPADMRHLLRKTASGNTKDQSDMPIWHERRGFGVIDADKALKQATKP